MAAIKGFMMTPKSLTEEGNSMKEIFLQKMLDEKCINQEQYDNMNKYCIVIAEKSFFGRIWDKLLWSKDPNSINIIIVKIL
jgi:hypothetical protein